MTQNTYGNVAAARVSGSGSFVWRVGDIASIVRTGVGVYEITLSSAASQKENVPKCHPICEFSVPTAVNVQFVSDTIIRVRTTIYQIAADLDFLFLLERVYTVDLAGVPSPAPVPSVAPSPPTSGGKAVLSFGANNISATTTTRYLFPWYASTAASAIIQYPCPFAGTISNLFVYVNGPAGNGNPIVYTLMINAVATALQCSLASTGTDANDTVNTVAVAQGDLLTLRVTKAVDVAVAPTNVIATVQIQAS